MVDVSTCSEIRNETQPGEGWLYAQRVAGFGQTLETKNGKIQMGKRSLPCIALAPLRGEQLLM